MSAYKPIQLLGSTIKEPSSFVSAQETINLWPRRNKVDTKNSISLYTPPGLKYSTTIGNGPNRSNGVIFQEAGYFVSGNSLIKVDSSYAFTTIGTISTATGRVVLTAGRDYLMITDGTSGYYSDGATVTVISDVDFPANPVWCDYIDGYFIVLDPDTDAFYICTNTDDPTAWNALDFEVASARPDDALATATTTKDLFIFGVESTQIYYNSGNPDFPFTPYSGGVLDYGVKAVHSVCSSSAGIFLLATAREGGIAVVQITGFQGRIISSDIGSELAELTTVTDAYGFVYRVADRSYYQLTFPTEAITYEYLIEEQMWVTRKSSGIDRYRGNGQVFVGNKNIIGDYENGNFYELDAATYTDNDLYVERTRISQQIHADNNDLIFNELVLQMEVGVGLTTGQGSDPLVMMKYSDDNGKTWSAWLTGSMGAIGEYNKIIQWDKLGMSKTRIFKFSVTDPVKVTFVHAYVMAMVVR